jgi:hypothetical protein
MNAFSSMEYPHWLIVAGAVLLALGFVGLAFRQRDAEVKPKDIVSEQEQGWSESEAELARTQAANRKAKLAEQTRERWGNKDRGTEERLNASPKGSDKKNDMTEPTGQERAPVGEDHSP